MRYLGIYAVLLITCISCGKAQDSCSYVQNNEGQRVSWKTANPIPFYTDSNFPVLYITALEHAIATLEGAIGRKVFDMRGTTPSGVQAPGVTIHWVSAWTGSPNQEAFTYDSWSGNTLYKADISINTKNFLFSTTPGYYDIDFESLILHELGHALGLNHFTNSPSIMAPSLATGYIRRALYSVDISHLKCEY